MTALVTSTAVQPEVFVWGANNASAVDKAELQVLQHCRGRAQ